MADAGIERRVNIEIPSGKERLAAWLYSSTKHTASNRGPALILGPGLGGVKEMKLDVDADLFNQLGYTVVAIDFRCNGGSTGLPRGLIDWSMQQADFHAAIAYVRTLENVDPESVGLFGPSFAGGHVLQVAAKDKRIKAVIAQCPFTDGFQSALANGLRPMPGLFQLGLRDTLFGTTKKPVTVKVAGKRGETALMSAPDAIAGYLSLIPPEGTFAPGTGPMEKVPARIINRMPLIRPGAYVSKIKCPVLFAVCGKDTIVPAKPTLKYAKKAPKGTIKLYEDMGHFDICTGENHARAFADYKVFLAEHLPA